MSLFLDNNSIVEGFACVDLNTGANTGDYVSLANWGHVAVVLIAGLGTAEDDPILVIEQADSNTGGSEKPLNHQTSPNKVHKKQAATSLAAVGAWSDASSDATANTWDEDTTSAEQSLILVSEFDASDLDVANGFNHIRGTVADTGSAAQPGVLFYILSQPRYAKVPTSQVSAL